MSQPSTTSKSLLRGKRSRQREAEQIRRDRFQKHLQVRSALAAALSQYTESLREENLHETTAFRDAVEDTKRIAQWLEEMPADQRALDAQAYSVACGIVFNACGRVEHHQGNWAEARAYYARAISCTHLADTHLGLAAVYFKTDPPYGPRNQARIEAELEKARRINPTSGKVYHYKGRLEMARGNFDKAVEAFAQAEEHPWTMFLHAQSLVEGRDPERRDYVQALELLERSIRMRQRADERYEKFCQYFLDWAPYSHEHPQPAARESVSFLKVNAARIAKELAETGKTEEERAKGRALMMQMEKMM
jgi:tetratricopeptide (TPR) repeat protein